MSDPARGYIHVEITKKSVEIVLKLATNGQSAKGFLLTSTFVPKGLSAPALGLYTCIKALKYIPGPGIRRAFTGPLVLWLSRKGGLNGRFFVLKSRLGVGVDSRREITHVFELLVIFRACCYIRV